MGRKPAKHCEYNRIVVERELIKVQCEERNNRLIHRELKKNRIDIIIKKRELLRKILDIYKKFSEKITDSICKYNCNGSCKQLCNPKILTDKEMMAIVKMQILTEKNLRLYNKKYDEWIHMVLCLRIFIKWYYDRHSYLDDFCNRFCSDNNIEYSNWENDEFFLCSEINWNFSIFS